MDRLSKVNRYTSEAYSLSGNDHQPLKNKPDVEIWKAFISGNKSAFIYIYNTYFDDLYSYARQFTNDHELIKDAIQDVFVRISESRERLSQTDNIKFYLFKSIKREVIHELRKKHNGKPDPEELKMDFFEYEISFEEAMINRQISEETIERICEAANNLNGRQREIIFYHFFEGFTLKQIKELMKFNSMQATHNLLNRALSKLRSVLDLSIMLLIAFKYF